MHDSTYKEILRLRREVEVLKEITRWFMMREAKTPGHTLSRLTDALRDAENSR